MANLDDLGNRHRELLEQLDQLRPALAEAIRSERAHGATYVDLMARSGYRSIETIRQIIEPKTRAKVNKDRRKPA